MLKTNNNMKTVCIVGVDGTGKSTIIKALRDAIGSNNCVIQYMGLYNWETDFASWCMGCQNRGMIKKMLTPISVIHEFKYRYIKHQNSGKVILFDRYTHEQVIRTFNSEKFWIRNIICRLYNCFLVKLYPKPTLIVYLYCNTLTSILRKDDITTNKDINKLKKNKILYDNFYLNRDDVLAINTDQNDVKKTIGLIIDTMKRNKILL